MKATKTLLAAVSLSVGLLTATGASAALEAAGGYLFVNDTDLNITWQANVVATAVGNHFGVSGISGQGYMSWTTAQSWIAAMNAANYLGFNDWRLPKADPSCGNAYNCTGNELGHLFYNELGGVAGSSVFSSGDPDLALFYNFFREGSFWTGDDFGYGAWGFTTSGAQVLYLQENPNGESTWAWAVRDGQVVSAVPEPEIYAMLLAGLGLIGFMARRRNDNFTA